MQYKESSPESSPEYHHFADTSDYRAVPAITLRREGCNKVLYDIMHTDLIVWSIQALLVFVYRISVICLL